MKELILFMVGAAALGGCSAGTPEKIYDMPAEDARRILLSSDFERGVLPGSSSLKPEVWTNNDRVAEWRVLDEPLKHGWWCALSIEPAGEGGAKTRVVNQCKGALSSERNRPFDELVDAALADRKSKFD
ncbi:MAG: hypothetical protein JNL35_08785 [Sphingopyxis sp.]|nr:hypothetical protein [Sphingopyxis sp.]